MMETNEATAIIVRWLAATPEYMPHLRDVYAAGGAEGMHNDLKTYFQAHDRGNATVEQLVKWGMAQNAQEPTRYRTVEWVFTQIDWEYVAAHL